MNFVKSLSVSIVSKSGSYLFLWWKQCKQDVAGTSETLGKYGGYAQPVITFILLDLLWNNNGCFHDYPLGKAGRMNSDC